MADVVKIGLIGLGTVGSAVLQILKTNRSVIEQRAGGKIFVKAICDKKKEKENFAKRHKVAFYTDWRKIVNDPEIDIVVELVGNVPEARDIILWSLEHNKHVVSANKSIISKHWEEIFTLANKNNKLVYFEASVCAGIPIIQGINEGLAGNNIRSIVGILNGTTNYILTTMSKNNVDFGTALRIAQKRGFAEADPSLDIDGVDTAQKLAILSSICYNTWIKYEDIYCEGIREVDKVDLEFIEKEFGMVLKLFGIGKFRGGAVEVHVHPTLIPKTHPLANVDNEYNAVLVYGDNVGDVLFYGRGAGGRAAASAIVSDVIYISRHIIYGTAGKIPYIVYQRKKYSVIPMSDLSFCYYLRFTVEDKPGVLAKITEILGNNKVSIASIYQKEPLLELHKLVPIVMLTHLCKEKNLMDALQQISHLKILKKKAVYYRII
jgi:homoserine dehydrogenase